MTTAMAVEAAAAEAAAAATEPSMRAAAAGSATVSATDAHGQPRVFGSVIDVGALELQQAPVLPNPIFANAFE